MLLQSYRSCEAHHIAFSPIHWPRTRLFNSKCDACLMIFKAQFRPLTFKPEEISIRQAGLSCSIGVLVSKGFLGKTVELSTKVRKLLFLFSPHTSCDQLQHNLATSTATPRRGTASPGSVVLCEIHPHARASHPQRRKSGCF